MTQGLCVMPVERKVVEKMFQEVKVFIKVVKMGSQHQIGNYVR